MEARTVVGLCERFHCLPSQLKDEDVSLLRYLKILEAASPEGS